ncbi:hypothetical protein HJG60_008050 [Phyllostomus discolor]|uniref:Uncharacterized protein n=1 Tax=Phyllostomus discolor TaxID=89673 RepID=A0A834BN88_9CHIR|nr:hypothetical protein HJG60_008050 [Phyllostomus discolor]
MLVACYPLPYLITQQSLHCTIIISNLSFSSIKPCTSNEDSPLLSIFRNKVQSLCYWTGPGPEQVCLRPACSVWVLDFMQDRFQCAGPGGFEILFVKAEDSERKEGLRVEEATGESPGGALLWLPRRVMGKK